jgi:glycerol kinase
MAKYILALDSGTTGNRAILFDKEHRIKAQAYQEFTQYYPSPGWVEHDPQEILKSVLKVLRSVINSVPADSINAIGITNQRETIVLWDKLTGKPVYNAIVWQCRRTTGICRHLKKERMEDYIHKRTGLFLDPYFSASKIQWILENVPGVFKKAKQGKILAGTIDTWLLWNLSEGRVHATDVSNASRTMLLNLNSLRWDEKLARIFRVPLHILPEIKPTSSIYGSTRKEVSIRRIPICSLVGDQQSALFAQGCIKPGLVKNTYGTGLFLMMNTGQRRHFSKNLLTTVAWQLGKEVNFAIEGSVFIGGAAVQWLRDGLKVIRAAKETEKLAKSITSNEGVYFVPALVGLGAPYWNPEARGLITGITRGTTEAHLARAALEAICYQTRDVAECIRGELKIKLKSIRADGGACANNFLMQFQADILGCDVERPKVIETTALGAAGMAGLATGFWKNPEDFISRRKIDRIFKPRMNRKLRESYYHGWKKAVFKVVGAAFMTPD